MLIMSHVLLVCIPIVFLSQGLARLNLAISGTGGVLTIFFECSDLVGSEHPDPFSPTHHLYLSKFIRHIKNINMTYIPTKIGN